MPSVPTFISSASGNVSTAEIPIVREEIQKLWQPRKHYNTNIVDSIKFEVGNYAKVYGAKAFRDKF